MRIKVADFVFEIDNKFEYWEKFTTEYITDEEPDFHINLDVEYLKSRQLSAPEQHLPYTEYLEVYREICNYIIQRDGILMHGAVIEFDGNAYMFTAPSGTGKTTHIKQWKKLYGDRVSIINGDKPIIRNINGEFIVYGTPWCGKEHFNRNTKAPLKGIVLLSRAPENSISVVNSDEFNTFLIKQVYMPASVPGRLKTLDFINTMFSTIPLYSLKCNISTDAALIACEKITKRA
ncbi:MAG: hypothetical protein IJ316_02945 [Clostridia bacterium]|nr:hypothetical protein [Clostridia bacterium]